MALNAIVLLLHTKYNIAEICLGERWLLINDYNTKQSLSPSIFAEIEGKGGIYLENSRPGSVASFVDDLHLQMWDACNRLLGISVFGDGNWSIK